MPKITIYQKPTRTTCRPVYNALKESGVILRLLTTSSAAISPGRPSPTNGSNVIALAKSCYN